MRAPAWAGLPAPANDTEARSRLLDAARRCFERFGLEKTSIADVAAEAGVTRRTVYRYFDSTDELLRAAFALTAGGIVERMLRHARRRRDPGERIIEAMLFLLREIPADPRLGPLFSQGRNGGRGGRSMSSVVTLEVSHGALRAVNEDWSPLTSKEVDELAELILRLLQSFLTDPGPRPRTESEIRAFLKRWLLPAIRRRAA
ncbi:MAG: TetR/AcrR family transcriptional regulator [Deltaproteobacteria bacterium]|nr:TetR/AcrR family transcriptional regulator [Deltaproteobacteria bacterium]